MGCTYLQFLSQHHVVITYQTMPKNKLALRQRHLCQLNNRNSIPMLLCEDRFKADNTSVYVFLFY